MCHSLPCKHIHLHIHLEEKVHNTPLREITTIPFQMAESFPSNYENKDKFNKYWPGKLLELHQNEQMLVVTYENTAFTSKPTYTEPDQYIPVRPCDAEEENQKIVRHA